MSIEGTSRWQWMLIALAIGYGIAWMQLNVGQDTATETHTQTSFEAMLLAQPEGLKQERPWLVNVVLYPPVPGVVQSSNGKHDIRSLITFDYIKRLPDGKGKYAPGACLARYPYVPAHPSLGKAAGDPQAYFAEWSKSRPWISARYAWWREPLWNYVLYMGGSFMLMGVIWPTVLKRLTLAGYGRAPEEQEKRPPFWRRWFTRQPLPVRFDDGLVTATKRPTSTTLNAEEMSRLDQMEEGLRDFLTQQPPEPGGEVEDEPAPEIKQLSNEATEPPTEPPKAEDPKDYAGEFYPTVAHGKKPTEEQ
jgi:hypothetical protein